MNRRKQLEKALLRDQVCVHCGRADGVLILHHRANRGMGGSKQRDTAANLLLLCSEANGLLESDAEFAELGRTLGWKLSSFDHPQEHPVYHAWFDEWRVLQDDWTFIVAVNYGDKLRK